MNRRVIMLGGVAAIAVVVLWWMFLFAPKAKELHTQQANLSEAQHQADQIRAQVNQLKDLQSHSPQLQRQLARLSAAVPPTTDQADFITSLNGLSKVAGITWQSVTFSPPGSGPSGSAAASATAGGATPTIPVQIQIKGGFFQITNYLNRLETLDRLVLVDGVQIAGASNNSSSAANGVTSGSSDLTVTLNARIFTQASTSTGTGTGPSAAAPNGGGTSGTGGTVG
jgi:Tfp pilus assembly protein PilO